MIAYPAKPDVQGTMDPSRRDGGHDSIGILAEVGILKPLCAPAVLCPSP